MENDEDSDFELCSSQPEKKVFDVVPEDKRYKFKVMDPENSRKISYILKQGMRLPYSTNVGGGI